MYSFDHPETVNPAVITNKESHMVHGNMNKDAGASHAAASLKRSLIKQGQYKQMP